MAKDSTLEFRKEKSSFFGKVGNFFKKNKAIISSAAILVGSIAAGIALFSINPFIASAILGLGVGVAGFNLSVAQHFKNSRQNSSSVKSLEKKEKSLGLKEKSLELRSKALDQMINTGAGYSPLPLTEQYVALQRLKLIGQRQILADQYELLSNDGNSSEVDFEKNWDALDSKYEKINQEYGIEKEQYQEQLNKQSNILSIPNQERNLNFYNRSLSNDSGNSTQSSSRESSPDTNGNSSVLRDNFNSATGFTPSGLNHQSSIESRGNSGWGKRQSTVLEEINSSPPKIHPIERKSSRTNSQHHISNN